MKNKKGVFTTSENLKVHPRMKELYKEAKKRYGDGFEVTKEEMAEFTQDGFNIIDEFLKRKSSHFKKKDTELVGIEMNLNYELPKDMRFVGYMDVVLHDTKTGRMRIVDIKTATMGWNKYQKADKNKTDQLLLYKNFWGAQNEVPLDKIDVEYFIVKRRVPKDAEYASMQRRVQEFKPNSGPRKTKQVIESMNNFLANVLDDKGKYLDIDHSCKSPLGKCDHCINFIT